MSQNPHPNPEFHCLVWAVLNTKLDPDETVILAALATARVAKNNGYARRAGAERLMLAIEELRAASDEYNIKCEIAGLNAHGAKN